MKLFNYCLFILLFTLLFISCDTPFSYSPFETQIDDRLKNTTQKNLERLRQMDTASRSVLKIALISDTHYHFEDFADAINDINERGEATFVVATGDITENGLKKEFEIFHQQMAHLHIPYLTVIGNHDYLANGGDVYRQMFGDFNYSFSFGGVSFVMFDNVIWESEKEADYSWLSQTLMQTDGPNQSNWPTRHKIVFSHIPPFDGQLIENKDLFHSILRDNGVNISIHGHKHEYSNIDFFGDGSRYVTVGSPQKRAYALLTITDTEATVEQVLF